MNSRTIKRVAGVFIVGFIALFFTFSSTSVCTTCGIKRHTSELQVPFMPITYFWWNAESQTAVSQALRSAGVVPPHSHSWLFAAGGGNGVMCAIGEGRHLLGPYDSPDIATFIDNVAKFDRPAFLQIVMMLRNSEGARQVDMLVRGNNFPPAGFAVQADFEQWKANDRFLWDAYMSSPTTVIPANDASDRTPFEK